MQGGATVGAFCGSRLLLLDAASGKLEREVELPGHVHAATEHPDGLYFAVEDVLYRLEL